MQKIKIVVWDNIGNVLLGVRPWQSWAPATQERLLAEDPEAIAHAPSFDQIFSDEDVELVWFIDPDKLAPGFGDLTKTFQQAVRPLTEPDALAAAIADADYLVVHKEQLAPEILRHGRRLRLIQHLGLDYRGVPVTTARELGVPVAATPLVNYLAVAEHVWALILNHLKRLPAQRALMQSGDYATSWGAFPGVALVRDLTLGLLGFGEIARPVARVAQAFDMPVIYWDVRRFPELEAQYGVEYVAWDEIFRRADVLSVQLALNEQTRGIVGAREIGLMKPTALFVNTARGKLVDQPALVAALAEGRLGGAALDVFATEPLPVDDPLHVLHAPADGGITLTPHSAWQSPWTWVRDSQEIWFNVRRSLDGEPVHFLVS